MTADYIIIGAGSAGCALAARLVEAGCDVLIIEYGRDDGNQYLNWKIHMPAALSYPMNMPRYDWGYQTEAEENLNNRRLACPRGKVWGGSSSINGMVYVRGHAKDFNAWEESGAKGWSYKDVLPYYMRMENAPHGNPEWRGQNGPLHVNRTQTNVLHQAFIEAGQQAGIPFTPDYNGENPEGVCQFDQTCYRGRRYSAARAYLYPALKKPNLKIVRALAQRIIFSNTRAIGVEILQDGEIKTIYAQREIILSASSINSPKLLMLSGIGNAQELTALGIDVLVDLPGVGENLQDHLEAYIQQSCKQPVSLNSKLNLITKAQIGINWLLRQKGEGATNHFESGAFVRSPDADYANLQIHFLPAAIRYDGKSPVAGDGFQAHVGPMRSPSRGTVKLRDAKTSSAPRIHFKYMSHDSDWQQFRYGIRLIRDIFAQAALSDFSDKPIAPKGDKDSDLDDYIQKHAESAYHPCGTCKMGSEHDKQTVVDSDCRVLGIEALRVVDSSIFPTIPYGNLNAPSIMVGEKAADHILGLNKS